MSEGWIFIETNQAGFGGNTPATINDRQKQNARQIYTYLINHGWSFNSICAVLANITYESFLNPAQWQIGSTIGDWTGATTGYGLVQWTPPNRYKVWADYNHYDVRHGHYQIFWLDNMDDISPGYWVQRQGYNITFAQFKVDSTHTIDWLTRCFFWDFEYGTWSESRVTLANFWKEYLESIPSRKKMPLFMMIDYRRRKIK